MILEFYFAVFVGFRFVVRPIIYKKSLFCFPTVAVLEGKRGFFV